MARQLLQRQLVAQFAERHLDRDLGWTPARIGADFSGFMDVLHPYLDQLAQAAQPQGLAVFGRVPDAAQRQATVLQALRQPLQAALEEPPDLPLRASPPQGAKETRERPFVSLGAPEALLVDRTALPASRPARWVEQALRGEDDDPALKALAERARRLDQLLATEGEMPGLLAALAGRFVPAAYGGDPIRSPDSLPTGRNLTGLDPSRLPTTQAWQVAQGLFDQWLQAWRTEHGGRWPSRLALTLWAGETLRHHGVMEAQALVALGVQPQWDDSGRPSGLRVIPAAELGRPRVDVLLSVTGSYRDQFPAVMALLDKAVALAAAAEPGNAVQAQTEHVAAELRQRGLSAAQAQPLAQARIFGNTPGDYGNGLEAAVLADGLRRDDHRLGAMFLQRMSQPYVAGVPLADMPAAAREQAFGAHLRQADAALMPRSSNLHGMLSSDDPFQYLGGLAAAARSAGKAEPLGLYVHQLQDTSAPASESAAHAIAREMQTRYLHPGWLAAQKAEGYAGTLQVLKALQYAWGWQVTAPGTVRPDHWQSFYDVLVKDREHLGVPQWLRSANPQAYAQALERLVQAERLGHWQPDAATRRGLAGVYAELTRQAPLRTELSGVRRWVDGQVRPLQRAPAAERTPATAPPIATRPPRGIRLLRQADTPSAPVNENRLWRALAATLSALCFAGGMAAQWRRQKPPHAPPVLSTSIASGSLTAM
jgi:cobaltochelatase CobN